MRLGTQRRDWSPVVFVGCCFMAVEYSSFRKKARAITDANQVLERVVFFVAFVTLPYETNIIF